MNRGIITPVAAVAAVVVVTGLCAVLPAQVVVVRRAPATRPAVSGPNVEQLLETARASSAEERKRALHRLAGHSRGGLAAVLKLVNDPDVAMRDAALLALYFETRRFDLSDAEVAAAHEAALRTVHELYYGNPGRNFEQLERFLQRSLPSAAIIERAMKEAETEDNARLSRALRVLEQVKPDAKVMGVFATALRSSDSGMRQRALDYLERKYDAGGEAVFAEAMNDRNATVRELGAARIRAKDKPAYVRRLAELLVDEGENHWMRGTAAKSLLRAGEAGTDVLLEALAHRERPVREAAADALKGLVHRPEWLAKVVALLRHERASVREAAVRMLSDSSVTKDVPAEEIVALLDDPDASVAAAARRWLTSHGRYAPGPVTYARLNPDRVRRAGSVDERPVVWSPAPRPAPSPRVVEVAPADGSLYWLLPGGLMRPVWVITYIAVGGFVGLWVVIRVSDVAEEQRG